MDASHFAHSANRAGHRHLLRQHLTSVAGLARGYVSGSVMENEAAVAALLHDIGKYGALFQRRLQGDEKGLDHWSQGAWLACVDHRCLAAALAIQGHHIGLRSPADLRKAIPSHRAPAPFPETLRLSEADPETLKTRFHADNLQCPTVAKPLALHPRLDTMLDVRRLFSALVDADFLDTEAHFEGDANGKCFRATAPDLQASNAVAVLETYVARLNRGGGAHPMQPLRDALNAQCAEAAVQPRGLYTLTAPTGSGKTLAMLGFALRHAARHGLRRVIMVIPYLTIIEQTAAIYRSIFEPYFGPHYVLEHHSLAGLGAETAGTDAEGADPSIEMQDAQRRRHQQTENWDAPLIVTTSVQMLESLFSNRPSACRKLHRLADSVILFDEVQTLPTTLAVPTLAALSHLVSGWKSTVVFATATQPAFDLPKVHGEVAKHCADGWRPRVLTSSTPLAAPPRVSWEWPEAEDRVMGPESLAAALAAAAGGQTLCILNIKQQARETFEALRAVTDVSVNHLSTNLCPLHRETVLKRVRTSLQNGAPMHLVATQCVEAGVDLDFPEVWRAFAPLDALIQAAGRCNRNGHQADGGRMVVFNPDGNRFPDRGYQQAAEATRILLKTSPQAHANPEDPAVIRAFYQLLYGLRDLSLSKDFARAIGELDFVEMARHYRLIKQDAINLLVPYQGALGAYESLRAEAEQRGIQGRWMREARGLTVSMFRPAPDHSAWDSLLPLQERRRGQLSSSEDWFTVSKPEHYHPYLGLHLPMGLNHYIA